MPRLNVQALSDFLESVDYPVLISISDCLNWCLSEDEDSVQWVSSNKNGGVDSYSAELPEGGNRQDGYFVANLDNQTGCWETRIFSEANELSEEDFYDKYEDFM